MKDGFTQRWRKMHKRGRTEVIFKALVALWLVALWVSPCIAPPALTGPVVITRSPVSVTRGHATTLPCWLSQQQSAEELEVRWYRTDGFDTPVMHYQGKTFNKAAQEASYVGRVSFGLKDAASGGLKTGDVSLKLLNVTTEDAGDYICYVLNSQTYDSATVELLVTEMGSQPFLSAVWTEDNRVNVSCESEGWYPQPVLRWSDNKQVLTPGGLLYRKVSSGLVSVHSWCLLPPSSELSCSVGLPGKEEKEVKVRLEPAKTESGSSSGSSAGGWVAFGLLLVGTLVAAAVGALYYKKKWKNRQSGRDQTDGKNFKSLNVEESEKLLKEEAVQPTSLSEASSHYENVKLEATEHPYLKVKENMMRDANTDFPDGDMVTCLTAIKGTPGFSSGKHYWEVSLWSNNSGIKQSWWVGVTSAAEIPADFNVSPNTSNGFWFLSSSPERADSFQFSTEPKILIPVRSRPQTVGVYLDRDSGEISFYNVEDKSLIGSFTATFKGDIFPLFNPGKGDTTVMKILQREEQGETGDEGN